MVLSFIVVGGLRNIYDNKVFGLLFGNLVNYYVDNFRYGLSEDYLYMVYRLSSDDGDFLIMRNVVFFFLRFL